MVGVIIYSDKEIEMLPNKVDTVLSDADYQAILAALEVLRDKLAFTVGLAPEEKRQIAKIGIKSQTFTEKALDVAEQHPELMPGWFSQEAAKRDLDLFTKLNPISQALSEIQSRVEDTQMVAGSEAYAAARVAYKAAKDYGQSMGLNDVVEDLSRRFQQATRRPKAS
ncbi:hypothetical protein C7271_21020 [filamentous cyanobacterium CCP5]|nr:hypothetical protein C7271_21020 [filamentous cyanobacterium CCP5]